MWFAWIRTSIWRLFSSYLSLERGLKVLCERNSLVFLLMWLPALKLVELRYNKDFGAKSEGCAFACAPLECLEIWSLSPCEDWSLLSLSYPWRMSPKTISTLFTLVSPKLAFMEFLTKLCISPSLIYFLKLMMDTLSESLDWILLPRTSIFGLTLPDPSPSSFAWISAKSLEKYSLSSDSSLFSTRFGLVGEHSIESAERSYWSSS